jgi:uncharacterized protein (TIGR02996 family)
VTEEEEFLAAIRAQPRDEAHRLVYADWLEEQGDPRAEFLRLSCQAVSAVRRMAILRSGLPSVWLDQVDLFPHAFLTFRVPVGPQRWPGRPEGPQLAEVIEVPVKIGERVVAGQTLFVVEYEGRPGGDFVRALSAEVDCIVLALLSGARSVLSAGSALAILLRD